MKMTLYCSEGTPGLHTGYTWVAQKLPFFTENRLAYTCLLPYSHRDFK
jgi:hypothetical protein